ncbi:MAG TPA: AMP-binding protein, partial [Leptolyngbyaceae cyanobacterium]
MEWRPIKKSGENWLVKPNLLNYEETRHTFSWNLVDDELKGWKEGQGLNIAKIAVDRHAESSQVHHVALRFLAQDWTVKDFTYGELKAQTNRFANVLQKLGIVKGDRVFVLAGRIPSLYIAALGTLK